MVRTAAETFFYNFNESKFFLDETKYLRQPRKVTPICTPPVEHLRIIDELYKGAEIYMTLYPQRPGTYFGAEICKCTWKPQGCDGQNLQEAAEASIKFDHDEAKTESTNFGCTVRPTTAKRVTVDAGVQDEDGPPAKYLRSSPDGDLRAKRRIVPRKSRSSPSKDVGMNGRMGPKISYSGTRTVGSASSSTMRPTKSPEKELRMRKSIDNPYPPRKMTMDGTPKTGRSISRMTHPDEKNEGRRTTTASQYRRGRRKETWGFSDMRRPSSTRQPPPEREPPPSPPVTGVAKPNCHNCRKCSEKLCLKCRMPLESCCCGIPNFLYCKDCEQNAGAVKNVGDPFKCRKCDQKLCLVCRQHVDNCCCPKPNFFVCRSCETKRRTRCCLPVLR